MKVDADRRVLAALAACRPGDHLPTFADLVNRPAWMADAACAEHPVDVFFPRKGTIPREARRICGACLVLGECRTYALAHGPDLVGVWAGTTDADRRALRATAA